MCVCVNHECFFELYYCTKLFRPNICGDMGCAFQTLLEIGELVFFIKSDQLTKTINLGEIGVLTNLISSQLNGKS